MIDHGIEDKVAPLAGSAKNLGGPCGSGWTRRSSIRPKAASALSKFSKTDLTDIEDIVPFIRFLI